MTNDEKHIFKPMQLHSLKQVSDLPLNELKLMDIYLSKVDGYKLDEVNRKFCEETAKDGLTTRDTKKLLNHYEEELRKASTVSFTLKEYCDLMGISTDVRKDQVLNYMKRLFNLTIRSADNTEQIHFFSSTLFDTETNMLHLSYNVHDKVIRQIIFDYSKYIKYRLRYVVQLTSKYTYMLYLYLSYNAFRGEWQITLSELKENVLKCLDTYYDDFRHFNQKVLSMAVEQINQKTDLKVEYMPVRAGRKVASIKFNCIQMDDGDTEKEMVQPASISQNMEALPPDKQISYDTYDRFFLLADLSRIGVSSKDKGKIKYLYELAKKRVSHEDIEYYGEELATANTVSREIEIILETREKVGDRYRYLLSIFDSRKPRSRIPEHINPDLLKSLYKPI